MRSVSVLANRAISRQYAAYFLQSPTNTHAPAFPSLVYHARGVPQQLLASGSSSRELDEFHLTWLKVPKRGTALKTVAEYRKFAEDSRQLAANLKTPDDKLAPELMAAAWEKIANEREAQLGNTTAARGRFPLPTRLPAAFIVNGERLFFLRNAPTASADKPISYGVVSARAGSRQRSDGSIELSPPGAGHCKF
jgi:hypothetical protein